jgi:hypothetical protein
VTLHGSPQEVAAGAALGTFIAFTPTIGFQIVLAATLATLLRINRPAAILMVWISNPFTLAPVYAATYWVGETFWPGPAVVDVYDRLLSTAAALGRFDFWEIWDQFTIMLQLGVDVLVPLAIGGVLVGAAAGGIVYLVLVRLIARARAALARRRGRGRLRRLKSADANA